MTNRLELNWKVDGFVDEQRYYCSETPMDVNSLPTPKAILSSEVRTYVDTDITVGKKYYVRIGSVKNGVEKISNELTVYVINPISILHFENGFADEKGNTWAAFGGSYAPVISTAQKKFGLQSLELNKLQTEYANGGFETIISEFPMTGDFTIEWFSYVRSWTVPQYQAYLCNGYNVLGGITLVTGLQDGKFALYSGTTKILTENSVGQLNVWQHHAITRQGSVVKKWRDGVEVGSGIFSGSMGLLSKKFCLGAYSSDSGAVGQMLNGYIDEFRIVKGVALYTATFTPPSAPF